MALRITDITLRDFRSYEAEAFNGLGQLVVLVGPNAVGKTNAIEAVQLLTALTTFRHAPAAQLLRHGQSAARLSCSATDGNRLIEVSLSIGETRRYQLNGKAKRPADLKGLLPSVTFTPDDLDLVKGPQGNRRRALDALGAQLNKNYYLIRKDYDKVLRHKNRLLKEQASEALLESIDEMAVRVGAQLTCYRAALFEKLAAAMVRAYQRISHGAEELRPWFAPSWLAEGSGAGEAFPSANALSPGGASAVGRAPAAATGFAPPFTREEAAEALYRQVATRRPEERARGRALVGPQADAIGFELDGLAAQLYGSQGQQRSIVLAWKLAEAEVIEDMLGTFPVLLLDDVMSELDGRRRQALVDYLAHGAQALITTANLDYFDGAMLEEARVVRLPL